MIFFKRLKNKLHKSNNVYLVNGYTSFLLPKRDVLNDKQISILTKIKEHYLNLLKSKILSSHDIEIDDINKKRDMYTNLLLNNMMEDSKNNKIKSVKLKIYESELIKLRETLLIKLIALTEILEQNKIKKRIKDIIINEINIMQISLTTIDVEIVSIHNEIEKYLSTNEESINLNSKLLELRTLSDEIVKPTSFNSIVGYIAYIEIKLELYCYQNKSEVTALKEELETLRNSDINDANIDALLEKIKYLEKKYNIYYQFSSEKNSITKEDMYKLYETKFYICAHNHSFTFEFNALEKEVYLDIISQKINDLLKGQSLYLVNLIETGQKTNIAKLITHIAVVLKTDNEFNFESILYNARKLSLLLSLDYINGVNDFFENTIIDINNDDLFDNSRISNECFKSIKDFSLSDMEYLFYSDKLPLISVIRLYNFKKYLQKTTNHDYPNLDNESDKIRDSLCSIASYVSPSSNNEYIVPEGIVIGGLSSQTCVILYPFFKSNIIMPKSLKHIKIDHGYSLFQLGNIKSRVYLDTITFQNGVESIDIPAYNYSLSNSFSLFYFDKIIIPPSVVRLNISSTDVSSIVFTDYKNSALLNCTSLKVKSSLVSILFKKEKVSESFIQFSPRFKSIIFLSDDGTHKIIDATNIFKMPKPANENFNKLIDIIFCDDFC